MPASFPLRSHDLLGASPCSGIGMDEFVVLAGPSGGPLFAPPEAPAPAWTPRATGAGWNLARASASRAPRTLLASAAAAALLGWSDLASAAGACSAYMGQAVINEVRVGHSNSTDAKNQVELYNSGNVAPAVWQTWSVVIWFKDGAKAAVKKGTYPMSTGHTATGQYIYNSPTKYWLQNRNNKNVDIAVLDANGDFVAYFAIEGVIQTVPGCYGATTMVQSSGSGDENGVIKRTTDGGTWPAALTKTDFHTIGRTNVCTAGGGDIVINAAVDYEKPVQNATTVSYVITAYNNACSTNVSGVHVLVTNLNTTSFSSFSTSVSAGGGSVSASGSNQDWNVGTINAGITRTLTVTGIPKNLGTITTVASVTAPASGLLNTGDDSDTTAITAYQYNYVGFDIATADVTEGTDLNHSAIINSNVPSSKAITVNYTVSGTAGAGDTNLASGSQVIAANTGTDSIDFAITNDAIHEVTKTIILTITSVTSTDAAVKIGTVGTGDILAETITLYDDDPVTVDHYELNAPSTGLACLASTLTVTACADTSNPCTSAATTISGQTATLAASNGTLGSTTLTFNGSGVASTTLSWAAATNGATSTVTLSGETQAASNSRQCCPNGASCSTANSCTETFSTSGFVISASAGGAVATIPAQTAGTTTGTYYLRAIQTGTTTKACETAITGSTNVSWAYQCNNPTTCSAGNLMTITGNSGTAITGNPNASVSSYTAVPMTFDANGNAPFTFNYADVGQVTLWASKAAGGSQLSALAGSSNAFVVKPGGFAVSGIKQTAAPQLVNPAAASAAGSKFVKAGESFTATVTAQTSGGATTPNYGRETSAEGVLLTRTLVLPAGGTNGTLSNGTIAGGSFSSGVATVTNLSFSEVGIITLTPSVADADYLGAGTVTGTVTGNIGRFFPAQFALSSGSVTHRSALGCGVAPSFSYLGENFSLTLTLTAQNLAGATTTNYTSTFAKLDPTSASGWNLAGLGGTTTFSVGSGRLALGSATGSWSSGVASAATITANASRAASPDGPFSAVFGVAPSDSDGVAMAAYDMASISAGSNDRTTVATVPLRFGRLRLSNAMGAADRTLSLPAAAQYWTGTAWDTNTLDSCTTVATTAVNYGNPRKTMALADMNASAGITIASGLGTLKLAAPTSSHSGTYDVALSLGSSTTDASCLQTWTPTKAATVAGNLAYLRGAWCSATYDKDPTARASFGLQRTQENMLFRRENY